jgi:hypothetical protein
VAPEAGVVLPLLDSVGRKISQLEEAISSRLEEEGHTLAQVVADHMLMCFRSRDPASPWSLWCKGPSKGLPRLPETALRMLPAR